MGGVGGVRSRRGVKGDGGSRGGRSRRGVKGDGGMGVGGVGVSEEGEK